MDINSKYPVTLRYLIQQGYTRGCIACLGEVEPSSSQRCGVKPRRKAQSRGFAKASVIWREQITDVRRILTAVKLLLCMRHQGQDRNIAAEWSMEVSREHGLDFHRTLANRPDELDDRPPTPLPEDIQPHFPEVEPPLSDDDDDDDDVEENEDDDDNRPDRPEDIRPLLDDDHRPAAPLADNEPLIEPLLPAYDRPATPPQADNQAPPTPPFPPVTYHHRHHHHTHHTHHHVHTHAHTHDIERNDVTPPKQSVMIPAVDIAIAMTIALGALTVGFLIFR